jgi:hypothetical protein
MATLSDDTVERNSLDDGTPAALDSSGLKPRPGVNSFITPKRKSLDYAHIPDAEGGVSPSLRAGEGPDENARCIVTDKDQAGGAHAINEEATVPEATAEHTDEDVSAPISATGRLEEDDPSVDSEDPEIWATPPETEEGRPDSLTLSSNVQVDDASSNHHSRSVESLASSESTHPPVISVEPDPRTYPWNVEGYLPPPVRMRIDGKTRYMAGVCIWLSRQYFMP